MSKIKPPSPRRDEPASPAVAAPAGNNMVVFRETIESIVVAFVLAFFIRTFEAEAFVIPTGSMSPALQGRHKDVHCTECGYRFRTTASTEDPEEARRRGTFRNLRDGEVVGGMCPMCRYPMPFTKDLPPAVADEVSQLADLDEVTTRSSYPGDRILVNKYGFDFGDPQRWDVVVFKFPGDGNMNYIKRLVGLPGEELQVYQGDVFARPLESDEPFRILRKPADKIEAMLQPVHDTDFESATLYKAGWPLRWRPIGEGGWTATIAEPVEEELTVSARYEIDAAADAAPAWLRYQHVVAESTDDWAFASGIVRSGSLAEFARRNGQSEEQASRAWKDRFFPQLITDFNAYNASLMRAQLNAGARWTMDSQLGAPDGHLGMNWVGDLAVEADVNVLEARGELLLDLVEGGFHFRATIDLASGETRVSIVDGRTDKALDFKAEGTAKIGVGEHSLRLANVDDEILLWVDGDLVDLGDTTYDPDKLLGGRKNLIPWASSDLEGDAGDLSPAGVGAQGAKLEVTRLAVLRDGYYIATNDHMNYEAMHMDYDSWRTATTVDGKSLPPLNDSRELFAKQGTWERFRTRRAVPFDVKEGQLFVMGDNSPESADCRLWASNTVDRGIPGGPYLDKRLLIGKAICVFWPHSWGGVPGLPKLPGWPNFKDMRLVR